MANSPHMPANMPISHQRIVRGDAVRRLPGSVTGGGAAPDAPRFSWQGLVNFLDTTQVWRVDVAANLAEVDVDMPTASAILAFDILVNGSIIDSVTTTATAFATYAITVPVVHGDRLRIALTSVGTGAAHDLSMLLREAD